MWFNSKTVRFTFQFRRTKVIKVCQNPVQIVPLSLTSVNWAKTKYLRKQYECGCLLLRLWLLYRFLQCLRPPLFHITASNTIVSISVTFYLLAHLLLSSIYCFVYDIISILLIYLEWNQFLYLSIVRAHSAKHFLVDIITSNDSRFQWKNGERLFIIVIADTKRPA